MKYFSVLIAIVLFCSKLSAQELKWSPKDVIESETASSFQFSPDGKSIVWVKRIPNKEKDTFISKLFLTRLDMKEKEEFVNVQMTYGEDSESSPFFSKDGKLIYFMSSREKENTLWALNTAGGEAKEVVTFEESVSNLKWKNDETLLFLAEEGKLLKELEAKEKKDNVIAVEDTVLFKPVRIFEYSLKDETIKRVSTNNKQIGDFSVSKDGKWLVSTQIMSPHYNTDGKPKPTYHLYNLENGIVNEILSGKYQTPGSFEFSKDGKKLYFTAITSGNPEWEGAGISELYVMNVSDRSISKVDINNDWGIGYGGFKVFDDGVLVNIAKGVLNPIAYVEQNKKGKWTQKELNFGEKSGRVFISEISEDEKQLVFTYSTASTPRQYGLASVNLKKKAFFTKEETLFKLNGHLDKLPKAKTEIITWTGALGETVEGILYYPINYTEGRAYPLAVTPHGGPAAADIDSWSDRWSYFPHLLAEKGIFTFKPNYHGSSNYGQKFVESIKHGNYYELEIEDILTGIDYLESKGLITKDSMAALGWSNGAILSTMLSVRYPELFKLIASGAGDINWTSDFGTCSFGVTFDQSYFGGAPWDDKNGKTYNEIYITKSPLFELEKVKTPTLIFHGSEDRAVPRDQGWEYYRALQQTNNTPVRFLWFPGQPHGLGKLTHQYRKMEEEILWIDTYLFGKPSTKNPAIKKDSPLAVLKESLKIKKHDLLIGDFQNEVLIPEVVLLGKDSISVGKFEVTNAQYAQFKTNHTFSALQSNFPVTGVSHSDAMAYTKWLSEKTGKTYRLPNAKEAEKWNEKAVKSAKKENTLNYLAGYDLTIDDAKKLQTDLETLKTNVIKEVGSFEAIKMNKSDIYDLVGNVREMTLDSSKVYGFGALDFADLSNPIYFGGDSFTGFRVVLEK